MVLDGVSYKCVEPQAGSLEVLPAPRRPRCPFFCRGSPAAVCFRAQSKQLWSVSSERALKALVSGAQADPDANPRVRYHREGRKDWPGSPVVTR
ncbi:hypothetical protein NDU88_005048 [Pleurodeles waltl]|uniref:Uncharacterized protein n=1 Tax=Pleurodeles waltl TaxID=8319 RepID=A0AAV7L168_PLEWA|nr:hypothetical protein NDU88_005048 [Pleurodeles waltl]